MNAQLGDQTFDGNSTNPIIFFLDTAQSNVWQIGQPQKTFFNGAYSPSNAIVTHTANPYPVNNISRFTFGVRIPYSYVNIFALRWVQKLDLDTMHDGAIVEFSSNGINWQNAHNNPNVYQYYGFKPASKDTMPSGEFAFSGRDTTWRDIWLCIKKTFVDPNDSLYFRFTLKTDGIQKNKEGWMMDNFNTSFSIFHPVKEISELGPVVVYPNITTGMVNIEMKKISDTDMIDDIELIDESGRVVERFGKNYTKVVLDISNHKPGLYYLKVTVHNKTHSFKVIYEKP
ncbi:MAG: T9SS type A sorting domain-containing protein [Bacteroidia bacterium]|jgi:hypothetical protein|nr:T9SS type A sorting domain-containing protein [Bacteroidia bacterium]